MTLYWVNNDIGSPKGNIAKYQFHTLEQFSTKTIKTLLEKGVIREVQAPPVQAIPDLKKYAKLLDKKGFRALDDILLRRSDLPNVLNISETEAHSLVSKVETILRPDVPLKDG